MNIKLMHDINDEAPQLIYWGRISVSDDSGKESTVIIGASRDFIADNYAHVEPVSLKHARLWADNVLSEMQGLQNGSVFLVNDIFRRAWGNNVNDQGRVAKFLETIVK